MPPAEATRQSICAAVLPVFRTADYSSSGPSGSGTIRNSWSERRAIQSSLLAQKTQLPGVPDVRCHCLPSDDWALTKTFISLVT